MHHPTGEAMDSDNNTPTTSPLILCNKLLSIFRFIFLGRILTGLLAAAYVCIILLLLLAAAAMLGIGLVRMWVENPVHVSQSLPLDYTDPHPTAALTLGGGVPAGQTIHVSLLLEMPESDYNRDIGMFQLSAELISAGGDLVAKSSRPAMLQFRSWPVRLMRTFTMGIPLMLGITSETQTMTFPILKHRETHHLRTDHVRITLIPRSGSEALPQLYDAKLILVSRLPWKKEVVYRWKWTFYVWTTLYIFVMLVMVILLFLKPVMLPMIVMGERMSGMELVPAAPAPIEVSESLRRWRSSRKKRKAALVVHGGGSSSEEEMGDSEAVS